MTQYIDKGAVVTKINDWIQDARRRYTMSRVQFSLSDRIKSLENLLSFLNTLEVKEEVTITDAFIEKAWNWIEDNMLSSNQQDKSRLYYKQFTNYIKGE